MAAVGDVAVERAGAAMTTVVALGTVMSLKPRPSRSTTPGTPPSRTSRLEPDADHRDRHVGGLLRQEADCRSSRSAGSEGDFGGPPTRNQVMPAKGAFSV